jgi:hypothetical protein
MRNPIANDPIEKFALYKPRPLISVLVAGYRLVDLYITLLV